MTYRRHDSWYLCQLHVLETRLSHQIAMRHFEKFWKVSDPVSFLIKSLQSWLLRIFWPLTFDREKLVWCLYQAVARAHFTSSLLLLYFYFTSALLLPQGDTGDAGTHFITTLLLLYYYFTTTLLPFYSSYLWWCARLVLLAVVISKNLVKVTTVPTLLLL